MIAALDWALPAGPGQVSPSEPTKSTRSDSLLLLLSSS